MRRFLLAFAAVCLSLAVLSTAEAVVVTNVTTDTGVVHSAGFENDVAGTPPSAASTGTWSAYHIDTVINTEAFVRYSSMLSYLSGACRRVGFHRFNQEGLYAGDLLTHKVLHNGHIHAAHTFLDLVHALDTPPDQVPRVKRPRTMDCL